MQHLERLLALAGDGNREAYAVFFDLTAPTALRLAHAAVDDPAQVEDVLASAYLSAWTQLPAFRASGRSPLVWLLHQVHATARPWTDSPCGSRPRVPAHER